MLETSQVFCTTTTTESLTWFRCTKTDRKCDGYLVPQTWIFESTTKRERAKLTPSSLVLSYGTLEEQRSPKYFSEKISTLISKYSSPCLWKSLVLQATWGNAAVKHALVAIALLQGPQNSCRSDGRADAAIDLDYNAAIRALLTNRNATVHV